MSKRKKKNRKKKDGKKQNQGPSAAHRRRAREAVKAFRVFLDLVPWDRVEQDHCFALDLPGFDHLVWAVVLGQGGDQFGLQLFTAPDGFLRLYDMIEREWGEAMMETDSLFVTADRLRDIPPLFRELPHAAGLQGPASAIAPNFMAKPAGKNPKPPKPREVETLTLALRAVNRALQQDCLRAAQPAPLAAMPCLRVEEDRGSLRVAPASVTAPPAEPLQDIPALLPPRGLEGRPVGADTWIAALPVFPAGVDTDDVVRFVLLAEESSGLALHADIPEPAGDIAAAGRNLCHAALRLLDEGRVEALPARLHVEHHELYLALEPGMRVLGVTCRPTPRSSLVRGLVESLQATLLDPENPPHPESLAESLAEADIDPEPPDPSDLQAWKRIDMRMTRRMIHEVERSNKAGLEALESFFGPRSLVHELEDSPFSSTAVQTLFEWVFLFHRSVPGSHTLVERMLEKDLPRAERMILEEKARSRPSLYRVRKAGEGLVTVEDVYDGSVHTVHDKAMAENTSPGILMPMILTRVGSFLFPSPFGPAIPPTHAEETFRILARHGIEGSPQNLIDNAHAFGRLWAHALEWARHRGLPKQMVNRDGERLLLHSGEFRMDNPEQVRQNILEFPEFVEVAPGRFHWMDLEPQQPLETGNKGKQSNLLATLTFHENTIQASTNSEERWNDLRAFLEEVCQVDMLRVEVTDPLAQARQKYNHETTMHEEEEE